MKFQDKLHSRSSIKSRTNRMGDKMPVSSLDMKELTFSDEDSLIFLTNVFRNGFVLGFWSCSPWGNVRNQERGWALIDTEKMEVVDMCQTLADGQPAGDDFACWRHRVKLEHGRSQFLLDEFGDRIWKMTENL